MHRNCVFQLGHKDTRGEHWAVNTGCESRGPQGPSAVKSCDVTKQHNFRRRHESRRNRALVVSRTSASGSRDKLLRFLPSATASNLSYRKLFSITFFTELAISSFFAATPVFFAETRVISAQTVIWVPPGICGLVERNEVVCANETHPEYAVEDDEDVFEEEEATAGVVLSGHAHSSVARSVHGGLTAGIKFLQKEFITGGSF